MPWNPPKKETNKRLHPIWGGIGFILIPVYLLGSYFLAEFLVVQNRAQGWFYVPSGIPTWQQTLAVAALLFFAVFAVVSILWGLIRGPVGGPTDIHYSKYRRLKKRY
jgi:hypothetical protein